MGAARLAGRIVRDPYDGLAEIAAGQHVDHGAASIFDAIHHILCGLHAPVTDHPAHVVQEFGAKIPEVGDHQALHDDPLERDHAQQMRGLIRTWRWHIIIVAGDQAADDHATIGLHVVERCPEHVATGVLEIDIDAIRTGCGDLSGKVGLSSIQTGIVAKFLDGEPALLNGTADTDHAATLDASQLTSDRANATQGGRNEHRLSGLSLS